MSKILVTGATGTCGRPTARALLQKKADVRVGVRSPESAKDLAELGAEAVVLDFDRPETLRAAFSGVSRLLLITPFVDKPLPMLEAAIEAAKAEHVEHLVRLSAAGADSKSDARLPREHGLGERMVERSGLGWTVLRPTFFTDNFVSFQAPAIASKGQFYGASHGGKTAYISAKDIGAVAAAILAEPSGYAGKTLSLTGGEALSDAELAERMGDALRKAIEYVDLDDAQYAEGLRQQGMPEWMVEDVLYLEGVKAHGWAGAISPAVEEVTGRAPERVEVVFERNAETLSGR